jgi:predicted anti-sigma-YlaC factor YlaD
MNLKNADAVALMDMPYVMALIQRSQQIDDTYFYGVSHLFFAALYASLPELLGGGPKKAILEFRAARGVTGGRFLLVDVFYARYYLTLFKRQDAFEKTLRRVLESNPDILPEARLVNSLAKKKAAWMLAHQNDYF